MRMGERQGKRGGGKGGGRGWKGRRRDLSYLKASSTRYSGTYNESEIEALSAGRNPTKKI